ncbi:hypothetical protein [Kitasatospora sp. NPDC008115]|uniref:hypothetical protein n=1 Tax=Kitasatospora sp. NPDC008115 TaxID=3364022 RepID=UPI0036E288D4
MKVPHTRQPDAVRHAVQQLDKAFHDKDPEQVSEAMLAVEQLLAEGHGEDADRVLRDAHLRGQHWREQRNKRRTAAVAQLRSRHAANLPPGTSLNDALRLVSDVDAPAHEKAAVQEIQRQLTERARQDAVPHQAPHPRTSLDEAIAAARERLQEEEQRRAREQKEQTLHSRTDEFANLARPVLGALKKAAGEGETRTWADIARRTGTPQLKRLNERDKLEVLAFVERATPPDAPCWSVLLAAGGNTAARRLHRDLAHRLGRPVPDDDAGLTARLETELNELFRHNRR